ncbi:MAG: TonB-dependent receptor [Bacteroidota bacterium]
MDVLSLFRGWVFAILGSVLALSASAQCDIRISGIVKDADTGDPLPFSSIAIKGNPGGVSADVDGKFVMKGVCRGELVLSVSHLACERMDFRFLVVSDTLLVFELPHKHNELQEVLVVRSRRENQPLLPVSELEGRKLFEVAGKSLAEGLTSINGVQMLRTGSNIAKPMIHGLTGSRVLILNNGIRQEGQQWGNEHAPEIDPFIANRLTVVKGAASVRYGPDAIAGVVLVETPLLPFGGGLGADATIVGSSADRSTAISTTVQYSPERLRQLSFRIQGSAKRGGDVRTPNYRLMNSGTNEANFSLATGWKGEVLQVDAYYSQFNSRIGIFSGSHIGNLTDLQLAFDRDEPLEQRPFSYSIGRPYQLVQHELFKANAVVLTGDIGKLSLNFARQYNLREEYDKDFNSRSGGAPELNYEITSKSSELVWDHAPYKGFNGMVGVSFMSQGNTFEGRMFIPNYASNSLGFFMVEKKPLGKWVLETGVRFDNRMLDVYMRKSGLVIQTSHDYTALSGQFGAMYNMSDSTSLRISVGSGWRPPGVNELYSNGLHHGASSVEIGNLNLEEEKSIGLNVSLLHPISKSTTVDLSAYYDRFDGFIYLQPVKPATLTIRGAFPTFRYLQTDADLYGFDLMLKHSVSKSLSINTSASLVRAYNKSRGGWISQMPADRIAIGADWNRSSSNGLRNWSLGFDVQQVFKQTRGVGDDYVGAPGSYALISVEAGCDLIVKGHTIQFSLAMDTALDHAYRDYLNRYRYFADEVGRNLTLRVRKTFGSIEKH